MTYWKRTVDYIEYDSKHKTSITNVRRNGHLYIKNSGTFEITPLQLALSTAKALITKSNIYSKEVLILAKSYIAQFPVLLDEDINRNFRISYLFRNLFRDFSKTSRVGELAQGINYFFAQNILGCASIADFDEYIKDIGMYKCYRGKRPDYVVVFRDKKRGLLESKGSISNPTDLMINGLDQCSDGSKAVSISRSYSSAVWFSINGPRTDRRTAIHYIDPEQQNDILSDEEYKRSLLKEYAKWFCICGMFDVSEHLSTGQCIEKNCFQQHIGSSIDFNVLHTEELNMVKEEAKRKEGLLINALEFDAFGETIRVYFGINESLFQFITQKEIYMNPHKSEFVSERNDNSIYESYLDGTWIKIIIGYNTTQ